VGRGAGAIVSYFLYAPVPGGFARWPERKESSAVEHEWAVVGIARQRCCWGGVGGVLVMLNLAVMGGPTW
jgi:hypothetical protein